MSSPQPPPGSAVNVTPYNAPDRSTLDPAHLKAVFADWAKATSGTDKNTSQAQIDYLTEILWQQGVFSNPDLFNQMTEGTTYNNKNLTDVLNGTDTTPTAAQALSTVSSRNQSTVSTNTRTGTEVNYIDLPTPEEFLDDFNTAYNIHISGLVQTGAVRPEVAAFARDNAQAIFSNYLRERVARLLKGEPLYKAVGLNADNKLVGSRTGQQADTRDVGQEKIHGTASSNSTGGGVGAVDASGNVGTAGSSNLTYDDTNDQDATNKTRMDEALVTRNKLGVVSNLSPLDYLKDAATAQSLNLLYEGEKGTALRERQTSTGGESFATRRL